MSLSMQISTYKDVSYKYKIFPYMGTPGGIKAFS